MSRTSPRALGRESPMPHPSVLAETVLVAPGPDRLAPQASGTGASGPGPSEYLRVRLARPERRNALDAGMTRALLDVVRADPAVPVLLESTDPAAFCAGADLTVPDHERAEVSDLLYQCYEAMVTRPGPVIAVVGGPAVGGGAQLAGAADLRIAGPVGGGCGGAAGGTGQPGRGRTRKGRRETGPRAAVPRRRCGREREADRLGRGPAGTAAGRAEGEPGRLGRSVTGLRDGHPGGGQGSAPQ